MPAPHGRRFFVRDNPASLGIEMDRATGAVCDVPQVTEQSALVAFFDFGVELCLPTNGLEEILKVGGVAASTRALADLLTLRVADGVSTPRDCEGPLVPLKGDFVVWIQGCVRGPAPLLPTHGACAEIKAGHVGVRGFLVVIRIAILPAG